MRDYLRVAHGTVGRVTIPFSLTNGAQTMEDDDGSQIKNTYEDGEARK